LANLDDVEKMLRSCDSSFGLGVTNKDDELRWFTSAHVEGTEEAIKMGFKFPCSEPSGLKNMLPNNDSPASNNQRSSCISESKHEYHIENQDEFKGRSTTLGVTLIAAEALGYNTKPIGIFVGRGSGSGVKEKQNSSFDDPVMNIDCVTEGLISIPAQAAKVNKSRTHRLKRLYKVSLTARVESSDDEESLGEDASKQGRIDVIDADEEITLVSAAGDIVSAASAATTVSATTTTTTTINIVDDITLAQALEEMKSTKPKKKGIVIQELGESTTTISLQQSHDKGKGILIEPVKPMKKKYLIMLDEETTLNLQAEFDEEERLAREKTEKEEETNISLIET
ncbi:ribonuclease H-like domain-containing protein, partial [Tanacetum coccineum]